MKVTILIKPNSKHREEVVEGSEGDLVVFTRSPAIENCANEAMIDLLARYFSTSKSQIKIVRGHTSKVKIVEVGRGRNS